MATPNGIPSATTPRNLHASTPNRLTASPRHNISAFAGKTLTYKSPAGKTPASLQGHAHRISISSHPVSTPLAVPTIHDALLNLNSPAAALIASIGQTGLTPIPSSQDGLGTASGIPPHAIRDVPLPPKNPEVERLSRLELVARLLKTKTAGRGITREGVERIAQIYGFTILWDESNLTIAGNSVDLEITFDGQSRDTVGDVQLRLNTAGLDEPQLQKDASTIFREHLMALTTNQTSREPWQTLHAFSRDLEYLSQLDYVDSSANAFGLMDELYAAFRSIWDEEEKRMEHRAEVNHICQSNIGKPSIDKYNHLGISVQYWIEKQNLLSNTDEVENTFDLPHSAWHARFSCEKGSQGIAIKHEWLGKEPLIRAVTTEDVFQGGQMDKPNWSVSGMDDSVTEQDKDAEAMMLDNPVHDESSNLDLFFTCRLEKEVLLPMIIANGLNSQIAMLQIDQSKALPYQQVLRNKSKPLLEQEWNSGLRWTKPVSFYDDKGVSSTRSHFYSLFTTGVPWSYPVGFLRFSHPKQYADALPILRQYALLWSILQNTIAGGEHPRSSTPSQDQQPAPKKSVPHMGHRSNKKRVQKEVEDVLALVASDATISKIDLALDFLSDTTKAKIEVLISLPAELTKRDGHGFVHVTIEIRRGGIVDILTLRGPYSVEGERIRRKASKVLSLTEDLTMLVAWLLNEVRRAG